MELQLKPHPKNSFPVGGILLRGPSVKQWIEEIQRLRLAIAQVAIYPIPANVPNSIWGCLVKTSTAIDKQALGIHEYFQVVAPNLFIAEKAVLHPAVSTSEAEKLFSSNKHIFHPEFGMVELAEQLNLETLIAPPVLKSYYILKPDEAVFVPGQLKSLRVQQVSAEDVLKNLQEKGFPKREKMPSKPLTTFEKAKLEMYRQLFTRNKKGKDSVTENTSQWQKFESLFGKFFKIEKLSGNLQEDFEDLEERNQQEVDRLLNLLSSDPEEALKYAIPLDSTGTARGDNNGKLNLSQRWQNIGWKATGTSGSGSGSVDIGNRYYDLAEQYRNTAKELLARKKYQEAAFVYLKLLKDNHNAALALESGQYYQEAAILYQKHNNALKAAECYEKGNFTVEAIEIYRELKMHEKVADLYSAMGKLHESEKFYLMAADDFITRQLYINASLIHRTKLNDPSQAQEVLLIGWRQNKDSIKCLNNYFGNISDTKELRRAIYKVYASDVNSKNFGAFLQVIKNEYSKNGELADDVRELAYEIIAANISASPDVAAMLKSFNPEDTQLMKDTLKYKLLSKRL